jgi:hypothetical protein
LKDTTVYSINKRVHSFRENVLRLNRISSVLTRKPNETSHNRKLSRKGLGQKLWNTVDVEVKKKIKGIVSWNFDGLFVILSYSLDVRHVNFMFSYLILSLGCCSVNSKCAIFFLKSLAVWDKFCTRIREGCQLKLGSTPHQHKW